MRESGVLAICDLVNTAEPGLQPVEKLKKITEAYYSERTIGYSRMYQAMGADQKIERLVRCWDTDIDDIEDGKYAMLDDGRQYEITAKQPIIEQGAVDLTLARVEDYYDAVTDQ